MQVTINKQLINFKTASAFYLSFARVNGKKKKEKFSYFTSPQAP